jgi:hypothetical protein
MNAVDLIYIHTITAMLDGWRADRDAAKAVGDCARVSLLDSHIADLLARRERASQSLFEFAPAVASA